LTRNGSGFWERLARLSQRATRRRPASERARWTASAFAEALRYRGFRGVVARAGGSGCPLTRARNSGFRRRPGSGLSWWAESAAGCTEYAVAGGPAGLV